MPARPLYFLVRPGSRQDTSSSGGTNNTAVVHPAAMVPLIAVDQLPRWLEIVGVPRALGAAQASGLTNLGTVSRDRGIFDVRVHRDAYDEDEDDSDCDGDDGRQAGLSWTGMACSGGDRAGEYSPGRQTEVADHGGSRLIYYQSSDADLPPQQRQGAGREAGEGRHIAGEAVAVAAHQPTQVPYERHEETHPNTPIQMVHMPMINSVHAASPRRSIPPHIIPGQTRVTPAYRLQQQNHQGGGKTSQQTAGGPPLPCRHWCHHGTCKWGPGCRYTHTMPTTVEGLAGVGLKDFPPWWTTAVGMAFGGRLGLSLGLGMGVADLAPAAALASIDMRSVARLGLLPGGSGSGGGGKKKMKAPQQQQQQPRDLIMEAATTTTTTTTTTPTMIPTLPSIHAGVLPQKPTPGDGQNATAASRPVDSSTQNGKATAATITTSAASMTEASPAGGGQAGIHTGTPQVQPPLTPRSPEAATAGPQEFQIVPLPPPGSRPSPAGPKVQSQGIREEEKQEVKLVDI